MAEGERDVIEVPTRDHREVEDMYLCPAVRRFVPGGDEIAEHLAGRGGH